MISSGINLVMTVIGFTVSTMFIVFVCTRLICARIQLNATRRSFARASGSDLSVLERGLHGIEPVIIANFHTRKYRDLCLASKENAQLDWSKNVWGVSTFLDQSHASLVPLVLLPDHPKRRERHFAYVHMRCSVCLSEYHEEDTLRFLPLCGHSFHASCIDIWLQQHSTCPVCRVSLRELPERKWFMQPMFSSAIRSQYSTQSVNAHYCRCMENSHRHPSLSHDNQPTDHPIQDDRCQPHEANSISTDHDETNKDSENRKFETPSSL